MVPRKKLMYSNGSSPPLQRDPAEDFATLIEMLAMVIESQRGQALTPNDVWINHAQILAVKLFK